MSPRAPSAPKPARQLRGAFLPYVLGTALLALAGAGVVFSLYAAIGGEPLGGFLLMSALAAAGGVAMRVRGSADAEPSVREALASTILTWLLLPAVSAVPYMVTGGLSAIDALFEGMSGFTTTGATTITDLSSIGASLLMWRSFSQWVGGVGIVVVFVALFPQLAIAGRQLFFAEVPGPTEDRLTPRLRSTAAAVLSIYAALTLIAALAFWLTGMRPFDSFIYSFASVAAGGFAPDPLGLQSYGPAAQWIAMLFMFLGGASFPLLYRAVSGRPSALFRNAEFRTYLGIVLVAALLLTTLLVRSYGPVEAVRHGLFQAVSIITTTGFASVDYTTWNLPAQALIFLLLFVGGSAASAAGGPTIVRWLILAKHSAREVRRALHPRAVIPVRVGRRAVPEEVVRSVTAFFALYAAVYVLGALLLVLFGADLLTALTASIACLGITGPGLGPIGPLGNYDMLHPASRLVLVFLMFVGRLEVITVLVVFDRSFWRHVRPARARVRR